jgi:hypothetical protein
MSVSNIMKSKDQILLEEAYSKILEKKEVNPYAVCTATVGRENEEKYKSCKKKVAKSAKKSGKKVTTDKVKKK